MLKISLLEFLLRTLPESFLLILGAYVLYDKKINKNQYVISGIILSICIYFVRMLPIHFGIHTVINMIIYIVISFKINKIPVNNAIPNCIVITIILYMCEFINVCIVQKIMTYNIELVLYSRVSKILAFVPSLILFTFSIILLYMIMSKIKRQRKCT